MLRRFCWTKFGSEAGESVEQILARKEHERVANDGLFLWGIGNSVAPGIRRLVALESRPTVVFSPMRAAAKAADVRPERVVRWREATGLDGRKWPIPAASVVTSRGTSALARAKKSHYALVCKAEAPLQALVSPSELAFAAMRNLESGNPLGFSQVTSIVELKGEVAESGPRYQVGFLAALVYPYFVELSAPEYMDGKPVAAGTGWPQAQPELSTAWELSKIQS
jgi:hypothetical protein